MRIIDLLRESRFGGGRGSDAGRAVFASKEGTSRQKVKSVKGRVKVFKSIAKALAALDYGSIFSTVASDRIYVITRPTWGEKSREQGNKVAKGFAAGTPFSEIKGYAVRTMKKHGKQSNAKFRKYKEHA
jgi:hypothetical protein